jgi:hypothetical protein
VSNKDTYKDKNGTTRVGDALRFLVKNGKAVAPGLLDLAAGVTGVGVLKTLGDAISGDKDLSDEDRAFLLRQLEADMTEMQEISKRWDSDMKSDSYLSKNVRPLSLIFLTVTTVILIYVDSFDSSIEVSTEWIDLLKSLLLGVYVAYFGSRGIEKFRAISK